MKWIFAFFILLCVNSGTYATCSARAMRSWHSGLTIEAFAEGPTCAQTVATIVIRNKSGDVVWTQAHVTSNLLNFSQQPMPNNGAFTSVLKEWISGKSFMQSADKLVLSGEFPFSIEQSVDQKAFKKLRKEKAPLFCYVQGMESGNCLVIDQSGLVVALGIQSFPG